MKLTTGQMISIVQGFLLTLTINLEICNFIAGNPFFLRLILCKSNLVKTTLRDSCLS